MYRTAVTNAADCSDEVFTVDQFTKKKCLQLCTDKCGIHGERMHMSPLFLFTNIRFSQVLRDIVLFKPY